MTKFRIYAKATTYYVTEVEAEYVEDIVFNDIASDEFEELDEITWEIDEVVEVKNGTHGSN
jgi:hypothetical protein